jgi:hypothetical protein
MQVLEVPSLGEALIVDKARDELSDVLAFPLRGHVTNTMDGCESEGVVVFDVA